MAASLRHRKRFGLLAIVVGVLALPPPAAVAHQDAGSSASSAATLDSATVLFRGRVKIGDTWLKAPSRPAGLCEGSSGLNYPPLLGGDSAHDDKCYRLAAPDAPDPDFKPPATLPFCLYSVILGGLPEAGECAIEAHGALQGVAPFSAPHCSFSGSNGGNGTIGSTFVYVGIGPVTPPWTVVLTDLGWTTSAGSPMQLPTVGSVIPFTGKWDDGSGKGQRDLVGLLRPSGYTNEGWFIDEACEFPNGATSFDINGIAALLPTNALPAHPK